MTIIVPPPTTGASDPHSGTNSEEEFYTWTGKARRWTLKTLPPDKLLPQTQPSYVASWIYVFGMGAIAALVVIIASGVVLSLNGPTWWHVSSFGHFVNSTHLWSVEFFFLFMVVHLWAAFTGYLLQTNFESEWIAFEAKDALNAAGIGAWFNVANAGQMFMWHITLLPLAVAAIVVLHVLLVRVHGVVSPIDAAESDTQLHDAAVSQPSSEDLR